MMKKALLIAILSIFISSPVFADGFYRYKPDSENKVSCVACGLSKAIVWTVKLPVRIVTSTTVGLYELVTDQDFSGFKEGYYLI